MNEDRRKELEEFKNLALEVLKEAVREVIFCVEKRWLTTREAVRYSALSEKTLRKLAREGEIYATSVGGGKLLFDRYSIDEFLLKQNREVKVRARALVKEIFTH